jgi:hypothetical protein
MHIILGGIYMLVCRYSSLVGHGLGLSHSECSPPVGQLAEKALIC